MSDSSSGQTPPPESLIDYPQLVDRALRQVVRLALEQVSGGELPGQHYFYISFSTRFPGVEIDNDLLAEHPETLSIVLQYQFENLVVGSDHFEVTLYFGGLPKHLVVPYDAVVGFVDPFISFAVQFPPLGEEGDDDISDEASDEAGAGEGKRPSYLRALGDDDTGLGDAGAGDDNTGAGVAGDEDAGADGQKGESDAATGRAKPAAKGKGKTKAKPAEPSDSDTVGEQPDEADGSGEAADPDGEDDGSNVVSLDQFRKK